MKTFSLQCSSLFGVLCVVAPVLAQAEADRQKETQSAAPQDPSAEPTAEDVLRALQHSRPSNDVLQPSLASGPTEARQMKLLPEGASIVDRVGRVERNADGWVFVSEQPENQPPLSVLPNATAEIMIRTAAGASHVVSFLVAGEVTVFRGANHLLLRSARRVAAPSPISVTDVPAAAGTDNGAPRAPKIAPPSAESVLEAIRDERSTMENVEQPQVDESPGDARAALLGALGDSGKNARHNGAETRRTIRPDGTILDRRTGRFIERNGRWLFVTDSDHPQESEPPWELLPCQPTEFMLSLWTRNPHGLVFLVSGELTLFDGRNYLLPRLAMRQLASDNLRK